MNSLMHQPEFSDETLLDAEEQRRDPRFALLMRTAKLVGPSGEYLCILRDASSSGLRIQLFHSMPVQQELLLELSNGSRHEVELVWERNGQAGLQFANPVEIQQIVSDRGPHRKRPVRLEIQLPAVVSSVGLSADVIVRNLSQQGARIESPMRLAIEQKVRLEADALPAIRAKVRWRKHDAYGLAFDETFRFDELAVLVAKLQVPEADHPNGRLQGLHLG